MLIVFCYYSARLSRILTGLSNKVGPQCKSHRKYGAACFRTPPWSSPLRKQFDFVTAKRSHQETLVLGGEKFLEVIGRETDPRVSEAIRFFGDRTVRTRPLLGVQHG